jgi:CRISPR/Cas system CMR-associated protein Cmr3 (group 5 of RAMP superfamily)
LIRLALSGISVWVESDWVPLKEAEMIHNTGKIAKKIKNSAMISLTVTLKRFWNFLDVRKF